MGCLIGTTDSERYAIVFNLKYDPNDYLYLPVKDIIALLQDKDSDVLEVLDLRKQPIVVPARYGLRANANGNIPKETLDLRACTVQRHLNFVDPKDNWQSISQKLDAAWTQGKDAIFKNRVVAAYPDLERQMEKYGEASPTPESGAVELLRMRAKSGFNPVYRDVSAQLRSYRKALATENYDEARGIYRDLMKAPQRLGRVVNTLNNIHYDLFPEDMCNNDKESVMAMRAKQAFINFHEAQRDLELLDDVDTFTKFVGEDKGKAALLERI